MPDISNGDVERLRAETPGCSNRVHFNNAGASLMPVPVIEAVTEHFELEAKIGGYEAGELRRDGVDDTRRAAAELLGADEAEIALTENATRAFDLFVYSIPFVPGDRVLLGANEYISQALAFQTIAQRKGVELEIIPEDSDGRLEVERFAAALDERVRLVSVGQVGTNSGVVQPIEEIGRLVEGTRALFLVDACQSLGQLPVRVDELGCHGLSGTGRKYLRGPRGTGLLYVRRDVADELEPVFPDVCGSRFTTDGSLAYERGARRFETWESTVAAQLGLGAAIRYALDLGTEAIGKRVSALTRGLRERLAEVDGVTVLEPPGENSAIATFAVDGWSSKDVHKRLQSESINVWPSKATDTPYRQPVLRRSEWLRASAHYFNNDDDIDALIEALGGLQ